jgi:hypothetical protein
MDDICQFRIITTFAEVQFRSHDEVVGYGIFSMKLMPTDDEGNPVFEETSMPEIFMQ